MTGQKFSAVGQTIARAGAAIVLCTGLGAGAAVADFRGGGAVYDFTEACAGGGWPVGSSVSARMRHLPSEDSAGGTSPSQLTIAFANLTEHYSLSGSFAPSASYFGAVGRQAGSFFVVYPERPLIRVLQRSVVGQVNPSGPNSIQNAQSVVLRLRIQNFGNIPSCDATVSANLARMN